LNKVWAYDPVTNRWTAGPPLPHPVAYAACASDGTHLYFAGGADGRKARDEVYALGADLKFKEVGRLPHPTVFSSGAWDDGKLQVLGGTPDVEDWTKVTHDLRGADLATGKVSVLSPLAELHHGIGIAAVVTISGKMFVFTGAWQATADDGVSNITEAFCYDFAKRQWHAILSYPKAVRGLAAVALGGQRIYLAGGYGSDEEGFLSEAFIYHTDTDRYTPALPIPFSAGTTLLQCGEWVYVLGGEDLKKHRTAQCFRISAQQLTLPYNPHLPADSRR
jgi:N-acetylneuraminic acid mutarotase